MRKNELIAYLAGIVDGEGYVGIKKTRGRPDCKSPQYHERIQIRMVEEECIALFQRTFGGNYYHENEHSKYGKRPLFCYQANDLSAANIIRQLRPFLLIKKRQADAILKLRKSKDGPRRYGNGQGPMKPAVLDLREGLYQAVKQIHHPA